MCFHELQTSVDIDIQFSLVRDQVISGTWQSPDRADLCISTETY